MNPIMNMHYLSNKIIDYFVVFVTMITITIALLREICTLAIVNIKFDLLLLHYLIECKNL